MARLLCEDADALEQFQLKAMESISSSNPRISCSEIPEMDLSYWESSDGILPAVTDVPSKKPAV